MGKTKSVETDSISENEDGEPELGERGRSGGKKRGRIKKPKPDDEENNGINPSEEVEDYNGESFNKQETYRTKPPDDDNSDRRGRGRGRGRSRGEFADENNSATGGDDVSSSGKATPPPEYDASEEKTIKQ